MLMLGGRFLSALLVLMWLMSRGFLKNLLGLLGRLGRC